MSGRPDPAADRGRLLSAGAMMAAGTVVSRLTGFVRSVLLLAVLGKSLDADLFATANTLPNSLYILVAGGVFNVVLVPQLVRAMRSDADGGEAFAQRLVSLGVLVLVGATAVLTALVPVLAHLIFSADLFTAELAEQRGSAYALMWWCMPQVFFYGVFVLVGQVLNARERFGPMMWAPIVNNVVACVSLGTYAVIWGASDGRDGFTTTQEVVLGAGATLGIALRKSVRVSVRPDRPWCWCRTHEPLASPSGYAVTCAASAWVAPCGWVPGRWRSSSPTRSRSSW